MEASILDLRKNMKKVMSALERNERVTLTRRRRKMAVIVPAGEKQARKIKATDLAAFGMWADREDMQDVSAYVRELRKPRSF
ncbi:type II toxin-antitoxin system Phd/YefM family antitoxin [Victivallaceae bacterium BBE-744-WT-12]|uniref:Type II toxin-antitoxin system Phd/YefM family antitoxin n=1 Tax=Victivallis lenta TaxID=2606640 RepID=A0A844G8H2_9BACT|nr:type II toxin-antitoxin system Phd/YefM family antitoxin [Victivallis lenta]MST98841.1 type II toxin-antitoxin system Phd/YefM family antitoxin [Victivallis lenta]